jgi:hypothetical protein
MSCACGCCATPAPSTPIAIQNRPGLSAITYRVGTFSVFRHALLVEMARAPELAGLRTRLSDDYTVTVAELWAAVADVLTFYQERIANEAFLRTARERDSVLRLVRLLDYHLRPGAAATTQLAFTLEAGASLVIPAGLKVQSVPGEGEKPQKFETLEELAADARFNRLRVLPAPRTASPLSAGSNEGLLEPGPEQVDTAKRLAPGDRLIVYRTGSAEVLTLREVRIEDGRVTLAWEVAIRGSFPDAVSGDLTNAAVYKLGRTFRPFGFAAPKKYVQTVLITADPKSLRGSLTSTDMTLGGDGSDATHLFLDARYDGLKPGALLLVVASSSVGVATRLLRIAAVTEERATRGPLSDTVTKLALEDPSGAGLNLGTVVGSDVSGVAVHELAGPPIRFWPFAFPATLVSGEVYISGRRAGWNSVEVGRMIAKNVFQPGDVISAGEPRGRRAILLDAVGGVPVSAKIVGAELVGSQISFAASDSDPAALTDLGLGPDQVESATALVSALLGSSVPLPDPRRELMVTIGSFAARPVTLGSALPAPAPLGTVAAALQAALRGTLPGTPTFAKARALAVGGRLVALPGVPGDRLSFGATSGDTVTAVALGLDAAQARFVDGVLSAPISPVTTTGTRRLRTTIGVYPPKEIALALVAGDGSPKVAARLQTATGGTSVDDGPRVLALPPIPARAAADFLVLGLSAGTPIALDARSSAILTNVAPASHGESVRNEILGDGDASQVFQCFDLQKKPVTHLAGAGPGGVRSSLTLLMNGVKWTEVPTLYGNSPCDEVYTTRIADDGTMTVQFGDGRSGARTVSGRSNVVASYRQGVGVAGRVRANMLTSLLDRPNGLKGATNPRPADGGADPETMAHARDSAPGTVRTFGRAVSLRDFEDIALASGEVAKAKATWVWSGETRAIHLTVAAQGGEVFTPDGLRRIQAALASQRDPNHTLFVANFVRVPIVVASSIGVDGRQVAADVLAAARAALLSALSFESLGFAQPVHLSSLFVVLQSVPGVASVDIDDLNFKSTDPTFRALHGADSSRPQKHLRLLPARPQLGPPAIVLPADQAWIEVPSQDVTLRAVGGLPG